MQVKVVDKPLLSRLSRRDGTNPRHDDAATAARRVCRRSAELIVRLAIVAYARDREAEGRAGGAKETKVRSKHNILFDYLHISQSVAAKIDYGIIDFSCWAKMLVDFTWLMSIL